ncbi:uncharacterized protein CC84DRAFT_1172819 [Paraphaeosphaeria sporulosa]|uniref:Uncharacterized protein n=1 Tax=Paraphaeosphaeria sporulosa TaxID=1460663 RepID=A0A177CSA0_9PLEO|nr:uncharacterized protein CC84DRAFT_1172819 [Paraphaeosphaeria sporulosa]OAG10405.1 hypothetical protein CC84DRAFT_1172819 [Paraphaeosphaeria sporulosa]
MPANNKRKAARAAKARADGHAAPDADSTLDRNTVDEMPDNEKSEDQRNIKAIFSQFLGAMKKEYPACYNMCPHLFLEDQTFSDLTIEDIENPQLHHLIGLFKQHGFSKNATGTTAMNLINQYESMKDKQKAAGQPSQGNTAAAPSTSYTAAYSQFLAAKEDKSDPDVEQLVNAIRNYDLSKDVDATTTTRSKVTKPKGKQKATKPSSYNNSAAGLSTFYTAASGRFLTARKGEKYSNVDHLINAMKQLEDANATAISRSKVTKQKAKQKAAGQSPQDNTGAGSSTSDTATETDIQDVAGHHSTDDPTCSMPWFERMKKTVRRKAMRQRCREKAARNAARESSQVFPAEHSSGYDPSGETTQNTHGATATGSTKPEHTKQDSAGQDSKGRTMASSSKDVPVPMLIHDPNEPNPDYDLLIENGFL